MFSFCCDFTDQIKMLKKGTLDQESDPVGLTNSRTPIKLDYL